MTTHLTDTGRALVLKGGLETPLWDGVLHCDSIGVRYDGGGLVRFVGYGKGKPLFESRTFTLSPGDVARLNDVRLEIDVTLEGGA